MKPRPAVLSVLLLGLAACATPTPKSASTLHGDPAHPPATSNWVRTELYFGTGPADVTDSGAESRWRDFLDREVSTRFPDGLSVYDVYGQWREPGAAAPERLRSKMLLLLYPDTPQHRADVEAIRAAWKRASGDQSVLRVTQPADVSF